MVLAISFVVVVGIFAALLYVGCRTYLQCRWVVDGFGKFWCFGSFHDLGGIGGLWIQGSCASGGFDESIGFGNFVY